MAERGSNYEVDFIKRIVRDSKLIELPCSQTARVENLIEAHIKNPPKPLEIETPITISNKKKQTIISYAQDIFIGILKILGVKKQEDYFEDIK